MAGRFEMPPASALQYFAALVADDQGFPLLEAAVAVAQDEHPQLDTQAVLAQVDAFAATLRRRLPADAGALQRLQLLNRFFFAELGFAGNVNDYYDPANSDLSQVVARRRGIPITLAIVYLELAAHARLQAVGVSFPGHFLVKLHLPQGEVVIDPFDGHSLSREQLDERLAPYRRARGLVGDDEAPLGLFLQAAPPRDILARMLRNLKEIHRGSGDLVRLLSVQERLVILLPSDLHERRDRGLVLAELGHVDGAIADIAAYLAGASDAEDAPALRQLLRRWRRQPPLH